MSTLYLNEERSLVRRDGEDSQHGHAVGRRNVQVDEEQSAACLSTCEGVFITERHNTVAFSS